jgi:lysophospholipase L1-like esterase
MPNPTKTLAYLWISSVDVATSPNAFAIVTLGDSITDGFTTTPDTNHAWPAILAGRFLASKSATPISVLNQGIGGNEVLRDGAGVSALARFDRDVLSRPGVKWVILLEGINDLNLHGQTESLTADDLIFGYRQLIERAHSHGIKVMGATVMPEGGLRLDTETVEAKRQEVNRWIRTSGEFDSLVDFDEIVRDPTQTSRLRPEFDSGDHLHLNDLGNKATADAVVLKAFVN